jgi:esterase/lipase superfamily enzyme
MQLTARIEIRKSARFGDRPVLQVQVPGTRLWTDVTAGSFERDGQKIAFVRIGAWSLRDLVAAVAPVADVARIDTDEVV